jgi:hypothetical protein
MDDVEAERRQAGDVADAVGVVWPSIVEQFGDAMETWDEGDAFNPALVSRRRELVVLAGAEPRAAVLGAWAELERSLTDAGERWDVRTRATAHRLLKEIPARAGLDASVRARINNLRRLRNAAAHGKDEIGRAYAGDYVVLALQLSAHVDFVTDPANDIHFVAGWRDSLATRD